MHSETRVWVRGSEGTQGPGEGEDARQKVHWDGLIDMPTDHRQIDITGEQLQIDLLVERFLALFVEVLPHQTHDCERERTRAEDTRLSRP